MSFDPQQSPIKSNESMPIDNFSHQNLINEQPKVIEVDVGFLNVSINVIFFF